MLEEFEKQAEKLSLTVEKLTAEKQTLEEDKERLKKSIPEEQEHVKACKQQLDSVYLQDKRYKPACEKLPKLETKLEITNKKLLKKQEEISAS